jgi:hypothetical protein
MATTTIEPSHSASALIGMVGTDSTTRSMAAARFPKVHTFITEMSETPFRRPKAEAVVNRAGLSAKNQDGRDWAHPTQSIVEQTAGWMASYAEAVVGCPSTTLRDSIRAPLSIHDDRRAVSARSSVLSLPSALIGNSLGRFAVNYKRTCPISDGSADIEMGRSEQRNATLPARLLVYPSKFLPLMPLLGCTTFHPHATMVANI